MSIGLIISSIMYYVLYYYIQTSDHIYNASRKTSNVFFDYLAVG